MIKKIKDIRCIFLIFFNLALMSVWDCGLVAGVIHFMNPFVLIFLVILKAPIFVLMVLT